MKVKVKVPRGSAAESAAPAVAATVNLFSDTQRLLQAPGRRYSAFSGSVVFHIILLPLMHLALYRVATFNPDIDYPRPPRVSAIKDRVLWLPSSKPPRSRPGDKASGMASGSPKPGKGLSRAGLPAPPKAKAPAKTERAAAAAPSRFELPKRLEKPGVKQTIIQPLLAAETRPDLNASLPNIALTTVETPQVNRPIPERFAPPAQQRPKTSRTERAVNSAGLELPKIRPGRSERATRPSELSALLPSTPNLAKPLERYQPPSVERENHQTTQAVEAPPGESIQVLALSNNPAPLGSLLVIPEVNQVAPAGNGSGAGEGAGVGNAANASGQGQDSGEAAGAAGAGNSLEALAQAAGGLGDAGDGRGAGRDLGGGLSVSGGEPGPGAGNARGGDSIGAGNGTLIAGTGSGPGSQPTGDGFSVFGGEQGPGGFGGGGSGLGVQAGIGEGPPIRMTHPENGRFDVVVVQSGSSGGAIPGSEGHLKGRPIYTVYLSVGAPKDWILQYALEGSNIADPTQGQIVSLSNPAPVAAPYPIETTVPHALLGSRRGFLMIHGTLDKKGRWKGLEVVSGSVEDFETACLPLLLEWKFRPATRDGVPVAVEVLLAIPPHRALASAPTTASGD